jgi:hypothetical protein
VYAWLDVCILARFPIGVIKFGSEDIFDSDENAEVRDVLCLS